MKSTQSGPLDGPRALNDALYEFCHDLRQPVATISALIAAAQTEPDLSSGVARRLRQMETEIRRMSEMADHVLVSAMAPRPLDATAIAREVVEGAGPSFSGTLEFEGPDDATVVADEVMLRRALVNLLENATRAAGSEGTASITVKRRGRWVRIDVEDSGPGFGAGPTGAAGLGLVIVERLVRTHGGQMEILGSRLGGALMRLSLPSVEDTRKRSRP